MDTDASGPSYREGIKLFYLAVLFIPKTGCRVHTELVHPCVNYLSPIKALVAAAVMMYLCRFLM